MLLLLLAAPLLARKPEPHCKAAISSPYNMLPGGGERYILTVAAALQDWHCSVDVVLFKDRPNLCTGACVHRTVESLNISQLDVKRLRFRFLRRKGGTVYVPPKLRYKFFVFMGNERAPQVAGIGVFNLYMCQFPFDLDQPIDLEEAVRLLVERLRVAPASDIAWLSAGHTLVAVGRCASQGSTS